MTLQNETHDFKIRVDPNGLDCTVLSLSIPAASPLHDNEENMSELSACILYDYEDNISEFEAILHVAAAVALWIEADAITNKMREATR
jgi:hypothetical protein